ncbi:MAG TPA: DMT family transporter [Pirellulaceae bacterium]|nr:DMT family transporter [Pirellulaceae bacterium]
MTTLPASQPAFATSAAPRLSSLRDPLVIGTICGLLAAVGYTATNVCLRHVATQNPFWVCCLRALPTIVLFGPWLLVRKSRGERIWPRWQVIGVLIFGGITSQLIGNILFQWSLHIVGLAMAVPLCLSTLICGSAILGRLFLKEPITPRVAISLLMLVGAIAILSLGATTAHSSVKASLEPSSTEPLDLWHVAAGVSAAVLSGVFFACLGVSIRYGVTNQASPTTTMFTVGLVGVVGLGTITLTQLGISGILATPGTDLLTMLAAGMFNAVSFLAMTKALQLTNVAYAYALNATQATMGVVAGVLYFGEASTPWLGLGVGLTIAGLLYMSRRQSPATSRA